MICFRFAHTVNDCTNSVRFRWFLFFPSSSSSSPFLGIGIVDRSTTFVRRYDTQNNANEIKELPISFAHRAHTPIQRQHTYAYRVRQTSDEHRSDFCVRENNSCREYAQPLCISHENSFVDVRTAYTCVRMEHGWVCVRECVRWCAAMRYDYAELYLP